MSEPEGVQIEAVDVRYLVRGTAHGKPFVYDMAEPAFLQFVSLANAAVRRVQAVEPEDVEEPDEEEEDVKAEEASGAVSPKVSPNRLLFRCRHCGDTQQYEPYETVLMDNRGWIYCQECVAWHERKHWEQFVQWPQEQEQQVGSPPDCPLCNGRGRCAGGRCPQCDGTGGKRVQAAQAEERAFPAGYPEAARE